MLETGDQPKQCRLAATRWTEEGEEFILVNPDRNAIECTHCACAASKRLRHLLYVDGERRLRRVPLQKTASAFCRTVTVSRDEA